MAEYTQISGAFGSERVPVASIPEGALEDTPVPKETETVPITDTSMANQPRFGEARAAREARASRLESTSLEAVGAAASMWDTYGLLKRVFRPGFENDTPLNIPEYLSNLPMALNKDERDYFLETAHGEKSAAYAIEQIQDRRLAHEVVGDHPIAGMITAFADPLWLAVPPAIRIGRLSPIAGRAVAGVSGAAIAGAITSGREGPVPEQELVLSMLINGAAGAMLYRAGKLVPADPAFPKAQLNEQVAIMQGTTKPKVRMVSPAVYVEAIVPEQPAMLPGMPAQPARTVRTKVKDAVWETVPPELQPHAVNSNPEAVVAAVDTVLDNRSRLRKLGDTMQWNMAKTMCNFGPAGKRISSILLDNNSDLGLTSIESHRAPVLSALREKQFLYEERLMQAMAEDGYGLTSRVNPFKAREAYRAQLAIENDVFLELHRRNQLARQGLPIDSGNVPERVRRMADAVDENAAVARQELRTAGSEGAENLSDTPGYLHRRWSSQRIDDVMQRMVDSGMTSTAARKKLDDLVALAVRRANDVDRVVAKQIGHEIVDRALRKGYFEDNLMGVHMGEGQIKQLRSAMVSAGVPEEVIERSLRVVRADTDEAAKAGYLKHRMEMDYKASIFLNGEQISVLDLLDNRIANTLEQYNKKVATNAAFSRKGYTKQSDIEGLREELLHSIPDSVKREKARELFDDIINYFNGNPAGARLNENFRLMQAYGRTISLAWAGLWQATEYANIMAEYGLAKTMRYMTNEVPGLKQLMSGTPEEARSLNNVLANHSVESLRLRPYIAKFEDGYDMNATSAAMLSSQPLGQLIPFANGMKYIHHLQAKTVGNLILDRLDMASRGNKKAAEALAQYGIDSALMEKVSGEIKKHGFVVDRWSDAVWKEARPGFAKMMDASVLQGRLGDTPAFAAFDSVGKVMFTYRTFVLFAHNKLLAGNLSRGNSSTVGLLMLYQFPLAMAAVQAQATLRGDGTLKEDELVGRALGQMGGLGLFSEPVRILARETNSVGTPALIPIDKVYQLSGSVLSGDTTRSAKTLATMIPVVSAMPFYRGMVQSIGK